MAQRLATEYVKACLQLSEAEMSLFVQLFAEHHFILQVKVFDNGNQEVLLHDDAGDQVVLSFERKGSFYVSEGSCKLSNPKLVNVMRKVVSMFKGNAIVKRIYEHFTMVYHYERGTVVKIVEMSKGHQKVIYEYKNSFGQLEQLFQKREVEAEIQMIHAEINRLLDLRNLMNSSVQRKQVDSQLQKLTHRLFVLEA